MGLPGVLPGGPGLSYLSSTGASVAGSGNKSSGVFADYPGATPKYALNQGLRDAEYRETMARLYVQVPATERTLFVNSCPPESRPLAQILCGAGAGAAGGTGFVDFLLTDVQENFQEKVQVVESLSDNFVVYTFGQAAPTFSYSGVLLNTYQDDQRVWMLRLYRDILRSTQLARRRKLARLRYDSVIVSGIFTMHSQGLSAQTQTMASFQFSFIPMQYMIYTPSVGVPTQLSTPFTEGGQYGLADAATPNNDRLRVASPPPAQPTAPPAAQPATPQPPTPLPILPNQSPEATAAINRMQDRMEKMAEAQQRADQAQAARNEAIRNGTHWTNQSLASQK
jgi:hypothetical protein